MMVVRSLQYSVMSNTEGSTLLSSDLNSEFLKDTLKTVIHNEGFQEYRFTFLPQSQSNQMHYMYHELRATVKGVRNLSDIDIKYDTLNLVILLPFMDLPDVAASEVVRKMFERELLVYQQLLPTFQWFQRQHVERQDVSLFGQSCLFGKCDWDAQECIIVLKDVSTEQYHGSNNDYSYEHVERVMEELGRFHAVSFAMKEQYPEKFEKYSQLGTIVSADTFRGELEEATKVRIGEAIGFLEPHERSIKQKVEALCTNDLVELFNCWDSTQSEPHSIINHGDCFIENILFKYENGLPRQMYFVNWRLTKYGSPAIDLVYFIFMCTDKQIRDRHYDSLISVYYKALREHLERLGGDANRQFPMTALLRQLKLFGKYGLATCLLSIPLEYEEKERDAYGRTNQAAKRQSLNERSTKNQISGIIRDAIKLGFL